MLSSMFYEVGDISLGKVIISRTIMHGFYDLLASASLGSINSINELGYFFLKELTNPISSTLVSFRGKGHPRFHRKCWLPLRWLIQMSQSKLLSSEVSC